MIFGKRPPRAVRRHLESEATAETLSRNDRASDSQIIRTPRMKPFARTATPATAKPTIPVPKAATKPAPAPRAVTAPTALKTKPRPAKAVARPNPRGGLPDSRQIPGHTLVVGRNIRLSGEISACHRLIVEGSVEADLSDTRTLQIADTGQFRGRANVRNCVVSGSFDGDLTVNGLLAVRAGGSVGGAIRYAEIEVERGGRITGSANVQGPQEVSATPDPADPSRADSGPGLQSA